jgi:hypothetical protein
MSAHATATAPPPTSPPVRIGVGIDTSRDGHHAAFLRDDHQPAAAELPFPESATGHAQFQQRLDLRARRHPTVVFLVRVEVAGPSADILLPFLHHRAHHPERQTCAWPNAQLTSSCGDPQRNQNYRAALFGSKKSDPVEARAAAHFAVSERTTPTPPLAPALRTLRQLAARLQAVPPELARGSPGSGAEL